MKYVNENGRSMVEMLGVLAIIGVLSVGGIAGYSKAMNKFKINKTTDQISMLVANIRTIYATQGNYAGLTNATAVKFGVVPNDMYTTVSDNNQALKNAFGGAVTIASAPARSGTADEAFTIVYEGLSQEACVTLATGDWGSGQSSGLLGVAAGNSSANVTTPLASMFTTGYGTGGGQTGGQTGGQSAPFAGETATSGCKSCSAGQAYAIPGGDTNVDATPMPVVAAVTACSATGTANVVGWKYY